MFKQFPIIPINSKDSFLDLLGGVPTHSQVFPEIPFFIVFAHLHMSWNKLEFLELWEFILQRGHIPHCHAYYIYESSLPVNTYEHFWPVNTNQTNHKLHKKLYPIKNPYMYVPATLLDSNTMLCINSHHKSVCTTGYMQSPETSKS